MHLNKLGVNTTILKENLYFFNQKNIWYFHWKTENEELKWKTLDEQRND